MRLARSKRARAMLAAIALTLTLFIGHEVLRRVGRGRVYARMDEALSSFLDFKGQVETQAGALAESQEAKRAFTEGGFDLDDPGLFDKAELYSIQGLGLDGKGASVRGTVGYSRLMGHMDHYASLEDVSSAPYLTVLTKVFDDGNNFLGIIKFYAPLKGLSSSGDLEGIYVADAGKTLVSLGSGEVVVPEISEDSPLNGIIQEASLLERRRGEVELGERNVKGRYLYATDSGLVVLGESQSPFLFFQVLMGSGTCAAHPS